MNIMKIDFNKLIKLSSVSLLIVLSFAFVSLIFAGENFKPVKGVTTKLEIERLLGAPIFRKEQDGKTFYWYETDDQTGYAIMAFDSENILTLYSYVETMTVLCPNCLTPMMILAKEPFNTTYVCERCGHKFTKTEGIGARTRQAMDLIKATVTH